MKNKVKKTFTLFFLIILFSNSGYTQEQSIKDLEFLIGSWEVREDNEEKTWWEKSKRVINYTLDSTYLEVKAEAITSSGKERTYTWLIHYNWKIKQFEMVSMFSNWHAVQMDILEWDEKQRKLTIRHDPSRPNGDYHERLGTMVFAPDLKSYEWRGENKYGDADEPSIWRYLEVGTKVVQ